MPNFPWQQGRDGLSQLRTTALNKEETNFFFQIVRFNRLKSLARVTMCLDLPQASDYSIMFIFLFPLQLEEASWPIAGVYKCFVNE